MRANGGDGSERYSRKVIAEHRSVTATLAITVPGSTCEQQQKQSSSSDDCSGGSFVGWLSEAAMRGTGELVLPMICGVPIATNFWPISPSVSPRHRSGEAISIAV